MTLSKAFDRSKYNVIVASDPRYAIWNPRSPLNSIRSGLFRRLNSGEPFARGKPLYSTKTLTDYVEDDLALLDRVKPDLVVGDFRLVVSGKCPAE